MYWCWGTIKSQGLVPVAFIVECVSDGLHTWHMSCMYISLTFEQELQFGFVCLVG